MVQRRQRPAIEYASDIGSIAFDLWTHGEADTEEALAVLWDVNPATFNWLTDRLLAVRRARPEDEASNMRQQQTKVPL